MAWMPTYMAVSNLPSMISMSEVHLKQGVQGVTIVYIYQLMFTPESSLAPKFSIIECSG
jgi:hypothetical protein